MYKTFTNNTQCASHYDLLLSFDPYFGTMNCNAYTYSISVLEHCLVSVFS